MTEATVNVEVETTADDNDNDYGGLYATYDPEDNKLRLRANYRLPKDLYLRVKEAGFGWAPKQELFVAPMWTPAREDLLLELCGEIDDEDTSLVDRAEQRADRFGGYRGNRLRDADRSFNRAQEIAGRFEMGQPILIGHHSQRRAERDKQRMERAMGHAVDMWDTAEYWKHRAAGALRHAKYKEQPDVRYRRIKGLEADLRKHQKSIEEQRKMIRIWDKVPRYEWDRQTELAKYIAGRSSSSSYGMYSALADGKMHGDTAWRKAIVAHERTIVWDERWVRHIENRLLYEKAMLGEQGGLVATQPDVELQIGGRVLVGGEWLIIKRVNKKDGKPVSVTTNARYVKVRGIEEIKEYQAPTAEQTESVKKATTLPPLCNYSGPGFQSITKAQWEKKHKDYKGTTVAGKNNYGGTPLVPLAEGLLPHRVRTMMTSGYSLSPVFITDLKVTEPPKVGAAPKGAVKGPWSKPREAAPAAELPPPEVDMVALEKRIEARKKHEAEMNDPQRLKFEAMREAVKTGVQVVVAPQLFPTPAHLADRMRREAAIEPGMRVLEPSAGTGMLVGAMGGVMFHDGGQLHAIEINRELALRLPSEFPLTKVHCADFLSCTPEGCCSTIGEDPSPLGTFDRIVMNPPFANADDIKHIRHALTFLKPGGRLVAICAGGPRQEAALKPIADLWEPLPAGTFEESGTNVNTVLLVIDKPE